jgi:hypothetical protein
MVVETIQMRLHCRRALAALLPLCMIVASKAPAQEATPLAPTVGCEAVSTVLAQGRQADGDARRALRREAESAIAVTLAPEAAASCYRLIARNAAEDGDYDAERLYLRSAELAPNDPDILEAVGRYYRVYRGAHGLFADSEAYYVRAEQAALARDSLLATRRADGGGPDVGLDSIRRGRVDLVRDEGVGVRVPRQPGDRLGVYVSSLVDYGRFALPQSELVRISTSPPSPPPPTLAAGMPPPPMMPTADANTAARAAVDNRRRLDLIERLRVRYGKLPYLDVTWTRGDASAVVPIMPAPSSPLPGMPPPASQGLALDDLTQTNIAVAVEDDAGFAPHGDLLWRVEYLHERRKPDQSDADKADRIAATATWTRLFGPIKADLAALTGSSFDGEYVVGGNIRLVHFLAAPPDAPLPNSRMSLPPRPPSNDYVLGYRREEMETPEGDKVTRDTVQLAAHFLDALPARTDVDVASLLNLDHPRHMGSDSGSVELRFDLVNRLIDRLLEPDAPRTDRLLATNRASLLLGYLEDLTVQGSDRFESRGLNAGARLELFSVPANYSTVVVELSYQLRDYYHLGEVRHMPWIAVRAGLGGP